MKKIIFSSYLTWLLAYVVSYVFAIVACIIFTLTDPYFESDRKLSLKQFFVLNWILFVKSMASPSYNNFRAIKSRMFFTGE